MTFSLIILLARDEISNLSLQDLHEGDGDHSQSHDYNLLSLASRLSM